MAAENLSSAVAGSADVAGFRVVVTGGANGIGRAISEHFESLGATVVVLDVEADQDGIQVDLADRVALGEAAAEAVGRLGGIDVLVNCAGIARPNLILELDAENYDTTLAVNLHAPVFLMHHLGKQMAAQQFGRIVNVTSIHARLSESGAVAYDISKAGLEAATRTAALEFADHGVLVNAVAPGFVSTRMSFKNGADELEGPPFTDYYVAQGRLPLRRAAQPSEIAPAVAFLASRDNQYITGQTLVVDGGLSSRF